MNHRLSTLAKLLAECWDARWQVFRLDPNQTVAATLALVSRSRLLVLADRLEEEKSFGLTPFPASGQKVN